LVFGGHRQPGSGQGLVTVGSVDAELGQQRVVERRDGVSGLVAGVHPDALTRGFFPFGDRARAGQEPDRVLGVDPKLERVPGGADGLRVKGGRLARGDQELLLDQVDPGDEFGDGVLDLQPGVHLEEDEGAGLGVDQAFHRPGPAVPYRLSRQDGGGQHPLPQLGGNTRRRALFGDLLMPPLD
jgi:hypothetical protein